MKSSKNFNIPILFIVFNRPDVTRLVFQKIREIQPSRLFVASDGPRNRDELNNVLKVRNIFDEIDWDCELITLFRKRNIGCKKSVSTAIDWFFQHVEMGIIFEDDCLPDTTFFPYCEKLLNYYRDDERIMSISGSNLHFGRKYTSYDFFSPNIFMCGVGRLGEEPGNSMM